MKTFKELYLAIPAVCFILLAVHVSDGDTAVYRTDVLFRDSVLISAVTLPLLLMDFRKTVWSVTDTLLACLAGICCISVIVNSGQTVSVVALQEIFPYVLLYLTIKVFVSSGGMMSMTFLFLALCVWSCAESVTGLSQVLGRTPSGHHLFGMTGSFSNPGPYGCFIAMGMAMAAGYVIRNWKSSAKALTVLSIVTLLFGVMVLPASESRTGWVSLAVSVLSAAIIETDLLQWLRRRAWMLLPIILVSGALLYGMFIMKKDSALGRLHIWNMEIRAIAESPLTGTGPGTFSGTYGKVQEKYFRTGDRSGNTVQVAGCPEYAFNEYLKAGVECGVPGLLLSIAILASATVSLFRRGSILGYGLVSLTVSAFFSYPLSVMPLAVCLTVFLGAGGAVVRDGEKPVYVTGRILSPVLTSATVILAIAGAWYTRDIYKTRSESVDEWEASRHLSKTGLYGDAAEALGGLYPDLSWNHRYLYDYGYTLHRSGEYGRSSTVLEEGADISSDPMFHNIIGKNCQEEGMYAEAESEYLKAHYMVPGRLYPLVLLMGLYEEQGRFEEAVTMGYRILRMPVNPENSAMVELQEDVKEKMRRMK